MKRLLTLLLLSMVLVPLSARTFTVRLYDSSNTAHDVSLSWVSSGTWVGTVDGSTLSSWVKDGKIWYNVRVGEQGSTNTYYHSNSQTSVDNGTSYTYYHYNQGSGATDYITWSPDYSSKLFTFTATSGDSDYATVDLTISWADNVTTSSVDLLDWNGATKVLTKDGSGSEWKLSLSKEDVAGALNNGDFYFRFIENLSDGTKYGVYPNTDQTALTVGAAYTSDVYATTDITTDSKKDFYWKFTPTGADNYTIYFKNDGGTRSVKVVDDSPEPWYMHSNLGGADDWSGTTNYPLTYNSTTGYYERTLTESEIIGAKDGDVRFRVYDGSGSWGPSSTYTFEQEEGTEEHDLTTTSTGNYISIPKGKYSSAKIEAKKEGSKVLLYVTLTPIVYYWVSPQITNGEKWNYFKMVPSRNRSRDGGDGKTSTKYFTFTMKNDDLVTWKTKSNISDGTKIQWYIERYDGSVVFRPESGEPAATSSGTSLSYTVNNKTYTDSDCGYVNYTDNYKSTNPSSRSGYFAFNKGYNDTSNSHNALAYTFMLNSDNGNVYMDYAHTSASTSVGYDLVGNFTSAKGTVNIDLSNGKEMTKYWYKKGTAYTSEVASADSIVYKVEVQKPAEGWGDLYIDVNVHGNTSWDSYSSVLRPLISLGNNLDGRALHGALTTAKSEQSLNPEPSDSYQSYTFSFNATTRTYNLEFNMPDATLSPGYENNEYVFDNSWGETITVNYSDATQYATAATKCYIVAGGSSAITLDGVTAINKADLSSFNLTYDGTYIKMNDTQVATGSTVYIKIQGEDAEGKKGDVHLYQYTFNAKMSFEPKGGLFINSAKIKIEGGVPPYRYEIWHYNTKQENGETVIDYANKPTKLSEGTFSNTSPYKESDNNFRISTPGFLKIIDAHGLEMSYDEVGGGFDFTYSTSENYKRNTTGAAITSVDTSDAGAYPNGADYWLAAPGDLTRLLSPTWLLKDSEETKTANDVQPSWNGGDDNTIPLNKGNEIYQTVTGLTEGTYTVQAIVRGEAKPIYLKLNDTKKGEVLLTGDEAGAIASINKFGRCEHLENMQESTSNRAWHKLEGSAAVSDGSLKIAISAEGRAYVDDVILLKNANTDGHYWTTAPTSEDVTEYDMSNRSKYNAFSFFDRGANLNSIIKADQKTVIGMSEDNEPYLTGAEKGARRHPCNVVTSSDGGTTWSTPMLALTDYATVIEGSEAKYGNNPKVSQHAYGTSFAYTADKFSYDRATSAKMMSTMLPFALSNAQVKSMLGNGVKTYIYGGANKTTYKVTFSETSGELAANTPFFFLPVEAKTSMVLNQSVSVPATPAAAALAEGIVGTYKHTSNVGTYYKNKNFIPYFFQDGSFVWAQDNANAKPFRVVFLLGKGTEARVLNVIFEEDAVTAIDGISETNIDAAPVYSVDGKLVSSNGDISHLTKGVYVKAGKKFIIK